MTGIYGGEDHKYQSFFGKYRSLIWQENLNLRGSCKGIVMDDIREQ
jgi:hypothetical protein